MRRLSYQIKTFAMTLATLAVLTVAHHRPWEVHHADAANQLGVGFLPVSCHLTCPVTDYATRSTTTSTRFVSQRFTDFATVVEQGVPIKIVYLGHRDGSTVMVRKDSTARSLKDLTGKKFARPSRFSNQYLVITKLMSDEGMAPGEIDFVDMAPPDMYSALASGDIDAYFVGEPHAAKAELYGVGRVLYHAKDIWPRFISCVLVVRQELIDEHPEIVRDLVRGIAESGEWAEQNRMVAAKVAAPYFRQDQKLLEYVLSQPPDRVSYRHLTPTDEDMQQIMKYAIQAGILKREVDVTDLIDRRFIPADIHPIAIGPR